ncbi:MAG TPA: hypothetical protein VF989_00600, partial [Polyangiaceae bacterium]
ASCHHFLASGFDEPERRSDPNNSFAVERSPTHRRDSHQLSVAPRGFIPYFGAPHKPPMPFAAHFEGAGILGDW